MADLILSKQERLQKMREEKRKRDQAKIERQKKLTGGLTAGELGKTQISNNIIDSILRDEDPFSVPEENKEEEEKSKAELKESNYVIDMSIYPPEKVITYERNV